MDEPLRKGVVEPKFPPEEIKEKVIEVLKGCFDPEIPVNIYEMGLIYNIDVSEEGDVNIKMTLTSPACPVAEILPGEVEAKVGVIVGVTGVQVDVIWDPPWNMDMMTEAAKLQLNMM